MRIPDIFEENIEAFRDQVEYEIYDDNTREFENLDKIYRDAIEGGIQEVIFRWDEDELNSAEIEYKNKWGREQLREFTWEIEALSKSEITQEVLDFIYKKAFGKKGQLLYVIFKEIAEEITDTILIRFAQRNSDEIRETAIREIKYQLKA